MMTKTDGEAIAVLQTQMKDVTSTLAEMRSDIKTIMTSLDERYALKTELRNFKLITLPLTIVLAAILTGLTYYWISHSKSVNTPDIQNNTVTSTGTPAAPPSAPSTATTNNTTNTSTNPPSSSSGGLLNAVPKVQGVN